MYLDLEYHHVKFGDIACTRCKDMTQNVFWVPVGTKNGHRKQLYIMQIKKRPKMNVCHGTSYLVLNFE